MLMYFKSLLGYVFPVISIVLLSCNKDAVYIKSESIPGNIWVAEKPLEFNVPMNDTLSKYSIYITLRNENEYSFSNLYLFIDVHSPMHITEHDTMECILATPEGKWLGHGLGDIWDNKFLFKSNVRFRKQGDYLFTVTQAMRIDSLPMIMDAGISIEKVASPKS
jgi:gliding motility-associated lipoprotein GldH